MTDMLLMKTFSSSVRDMLLIKGSSSPSDKKEPIKGSSSFPKNPNKQMMGSLSTEGTDEGPFLSDTI